MGKLTRISRLQKYSFKALCWIVIKSNSVCCICLCIFAFLLLCLVFLCCCLLCCPLDRVLYYDICHFCRPYYKVWVLLCNQLGFLPTRFGSVPMLWFSIKFLLFRKKKKKKKKNSKNLLDGEMNELWYQSLQNITTVDHALEILQSSLSDSSFSWKFNRAHLKMPAAVAEM